MSENTMLHEAIDAIEKGQRSRARDLLTRLLRSDQNNAEYWIWMSSVVESITERIYCLESALRIDPTNPTAMRGLVTLGARSPDSHIQPVFPTRRKWGSFHEDEDRSPKNKLQQIWSQPRLRYLSIGVFGFLILILISSLGLRGRASREKPVNIAALTPRVMAPPSKTPTLLPTATLVVKSPTPTFVGPTPLWMLLPATYTPSPVYINTPHAIIEAYSAGMRAYSRGDYQNMLSFMQEANKFDPTAVDTKYYMGEAYRLLGDSQKAIDAYNEAIQTNPKFAPAYMGRALVTYALDKKANVEADYQKAIELDPRLADAYLSYSVFLLDRGSPDKALEQLAVAERLVPDSALLYTYKAQAYLGLKETFKALENAQMAFSLDRTLLPVYITLSQVYYETGELDQALTYLKTYLLYKNDDPTAWVLLGQINYQLGTDYAAALEALDKAIALDKTQVNAYYYRGLIYIEEKESQKAVNDIYVALKADGHSFDYNLAFGQALMSAGRIEEAYRQLLSTEALAQDDQQKAGVYYWRALALEALGNPTAAVHDWRALLSLPAGSASRDWMDVAEEHLLKLNPPTPTPTGSATLVTTGTAPPKQSTPTQTKTVVPKP
ncbi:MAG: tetratricopeptide repeat protein [Omnitrophica WOR_2 bacterium]